MPMKVLITEKLSEHRYKTPEGYLVCVDAILARTGPQVYKHNQVYDGSTDEITDVEVDRKPEQVFSPQAIASFENKPLTIQHPNEPVTVQNHKDLYHGFARDIRRAVKRNGQILTGSKRPNTLQEGDQEVLVGNIIVTTSDAIEEIDNGLEFLSCGYDCDITQTDKPEQINIRGNHIALCDNPRAGITMLQDNVELAELPVKHIVKVLTDAVIEQASKVRMNDDTVTLHLRSTIPDRLWTRYHDDIAKIVLKYNGKSTYIPERGLYRITGTKELIAAVKKEFAGETMYITVHDTLDSQVEDAPVTKLVKASKYLANKQSYSEYTSVKIERRGGGYIAVTGSKSNVEKFVKEHISRGGIVEDAINYVVMCEVLYNGVAVKSRAPWIVFRSEDKSKAERFVRENNAKAKSLVGFSQHYYIK